MTIAMLYRFKEVIKKFKGLIMNNIPRPVSKLSDSYTSQPKTKPIDSNIPQSICAVSSLTNKPKNQDDCKYSFVKEANAHILVVADGVGSHKFAEVGSSFVVKKAVELLEEAVKLSPETLDFDSIFFEIQSALDIHIENNFPDKSDLKPGACFGTTLIVGIDFPDRFVAAYVGNGSIFNISGYFANFPPSIYLPWNAINMLNPHTIEQDGREALYKIFTWKGEKQDFTPTVFELKKNKDLPGEIFVLTTDGVYSADHSIPGKDGENTIWIPSSRTTEILYDYLKNYMLDKSISFDNNALERMLGRYLQNVKESKAMDDDTTLGVIVTGNCLNYFTDKRSKTE